MPLLDFKSVRQMNNCFENCTNLITLPAFNVINVTTFDNTFAGCTSLTTAPLSNINANISFAGCALNYSAIKDIIANLIAIPTVPVTTPPTTQPTKTLTVLGNPGAGSLTVADKKVATDKNWILA